MKLTIICEKDEDGHFVMECPELPGCLSEGDTLDEALESINEAIAGCITSRIKTATRTLLNSKTPDNLSFSLEIPESTHAQTTPGIRRSSRGCFQTSRWLDFFDPDITPGLYRFSQFYVHDDR